MTCSEADDATILCLCSGNYCRSPLAEGLLRAQLGRRGGTRRVRVTSAGTTWHHAGQPPAAPVIELVRQRSASNFTYTPHRVAANGVSQADLILVMAAEHRDWIAAHYPEASRRTMLLAEAIGQSFDIPDPGDDATVTLEEAADLIEQCVRDGFDVIVERTTALRSARITSG